MSNYKRYLKLHIEQGQSLFLWGARKTGKSTFLKNNIQSSRYIDLLKTDILLRYTKEPHLLREETLCMTKEELSYPIIIDEVQKVPPLLDEVHWLIENSNATFILCGSSSRKLKMRGTNLLGGRALKYYFYPLVYPEYKKNFDLTKIFNQGLVPSHFTSSIPRKLLKAYVEDYLTNEIRAEGYVRNIAGFSKFLDSTRFSCGEMLNYTNIAREVGIDAKTIKEYYQILVDTLVGYLIYPYTKKVSRNIIAKTPKFYFFDVGLSNRIAQRSYSRLEGPEAGKSLENFILMELMAYINLNDSDYQINYWRTNTGLEVDFILSNGISKPIPLEIKISKSVHKTDLKSIKSFMNEHNIDESYVISMESHRRVISIEESKKIIIYPVQEFLELLWNHEIIRG